MHECIHTYTYIQTDLINTYFQTDTTFLKSSYTLSHTAFRFRGRGVAAEGEIRFDVLFIRAFFVFGIGRVIVVVCSIFAGIYWCLRGEREGDRVVCMFIITLYTIKLLYVEPTYST